jgi:hypothetical protein
MQVMGRDAVVQRKLEEGVPVIKLITRNGVFVFGAPTSMAVVSWESLPSCTCSCIAVSPAATYLPLTPASLLVVAACTRRMSQAC